jgi:hypothetical protein
MMVGVCLLLPCRFSAKKNFFKFRVSPIVSGAVYVSYMVFLITVLDRQVCPNPKR